MCPRWLIAALLLSAAAAQAGEGEWAFVAGRSTESGETDVARLLYRQGLPASARWAPTHLQLGAGVWRVPDFRGRTRRFDLNATPVWRSETGWGFVEAGLGAYLLSHTINNATHRLPSSFQFGSHVGVAFRLGRGSSVGIAVQHLSNAGLKQPNGGIDLILLQYTLAAGPSA